MTIQDVRESADRVRSIPLSAVLGLVGAEQDRYDRARWHTGKGVLSVTGAKFMNWRQGVGGGGAIDLVIHLEDLGFRAAVEWLSRRFPDAGTPDRPQPPHSDLKLPPRDAERLPLVTRYLVQERRLPPWVIGPLVRTGRIYADRRANAVFLLLGEEDRPVGAELRGTTHRPWRGLAPGSRKDRGYFSVKTPGATTIVLCESAIDALSCHALHSRFLCISTAGARPNPRWLAALVERGRQVCCGFDADPTGDEMARAMIALHPTVKRQRPAQKDWNDVLRSQA